MAQSEVVVLHPLQKELDDAVELGATDQAESERLLRVNVLGSEDGSAEALKIREQAVYKLGELFAKSNQVSKLESLLRECRPFFRLLPKARTAKTVRTLVDLIGNIPGTLDLQVSLCKESVAWCKQEKRNFLRMRIQSKLAALLLDQGSFQPALALAQSLAREVKKLDDKPLLVEVHLTESKVHYALKNFPKARATLTAARTAAISVYLGPEVQARIDAQAGSLSAEDRDYKTAYSYFFEGFEAASHMGDTDAALAALRRMLLAKIMNGDVSLTLRSILEPPHYLVFHLIKLPIHGHPPSGATACFSECSHPFASQTDDAMALINGKHGVEHAGPAIEAMRTVALAFKARSLHAFLRAQRNFAGVLQEDVLVEYHLNLLADTMLEANLLRVVEPYSRVELEHVARSIALPLAQVEAKLSQMILDGGLNGTLDQGKGHLIVFRDEGGDPGYEAALKAVAALDGVVDGLFERAKGLS